MNLLRRMLRAPIVGCAKRLGQDRGVRVEAQVCETAVADGPHVGEGHIDRNTLRPGLSLQPPERDHLLTGRDEFLRDDANVERPVERGEERFGYVRRTFEATASGGPLPAARTRPGSIGGYRPARGGPELTRHRTRERASRYQSFGRPSVYVMGEDTARQRVVRMAGDREPPPLRARGSRMRSDRTALRAPAACPR